MDLQVMKAERSLGGGPWRPHHADYWYVLVKMGTNLVNIRIYDDDIEDGALEWPVASPTVLGPLMIPMGRGRAKLTQGLVTVQVPRTVALDFLGWLRVLYGLDPSWGPR